MAPAGAPAGSQPSYVTFEGNGRREALKRAFNTMPDVNVEVEVRLYKFADRATAVMVSDSVATCRRYKAVPVEE